MIRKVRRHGRSKVIAIPKEILREFNIKEGSNLKFIMQGNKVVLEVVNNG